VVFLLTEVFGMQIYVMGKYLMPVLLIVVGANVLFKYNRR
jgi:hypothetical protein